jgi:hypothetical protein
MESQCHEAGDRVFHEDRRAVWRVTWTLALAFVGVAWLMQRGDALLWPLFAGAALLLAGIGVSALLARSKAVVGVTREGLRLFAGDVGLAGGARGDGGTFTISWDAVTGVAFEERVVHRRRGREANAVKVEPLCFRIAESAPSPDGGYGFPERLVGRDSEMAVGEFFLWNPQQRTLDLATPPRGGFSALTAAVARAAPRLGDASAERRQGLGGPLAYAVYDAGVALALVGTVALWATGRADVPASLAARLLAWGASVVP